MESRQRGAATRWLAAALLLALSVGCAPSTPDAATAGDDAGRVDPDEIERLRALGYVGLADPLPPDAAVGVLSFDRERAQPGLNLLTNAHFCSAQLMDMEGEILHAWSYEPCFRWGQRRARAVRRSAGHGARAARRDSRDGPRFAIPAAHGLGGQHRLAPHPGRTPRRRRHARRTDPDPDLRAARDRGRRSGHAAARQLVAAALGRG